MATVTTDVDFSESRGTEVNVIAWVFTSIAIATVFLKLFARAQTAKRLGWDDFFIFASLVRKAMHPAASKQNLDKTDVLQRPSASLLRHSSHTRSPLV
jgi:hypothetical protein